MSPYMGPSQVWPSLPPRPWQPGPAAAHSNTTSVNYRDLVTRAPEGRAESGPAYPAEETADVSQPGALQADFNRPSAHKEVATELRVHRLTLAELTAMFDAAYANWSCETDIDLGCLQAGDATVWPTAKRIVAGAPTSEEEDRTLDAELEAEAEAEVRALMTNLRKVRNPARQEPQKPGKPRLLRHRHAQLGRSASMPGYTEQNLFLSGFGGSLDFDSNLTVDIHAFGKPQDCRNPQNRTKKGCYAARLLRPSEETRAAVSKGRTKMVRTSSRPLNGQEKPDSTRRRQEQPAHSGSKEPKEKPDASRRRQEQLAHDGSKEPKDHRADRIGSLAAPLPRLPAGRARGGDYNRPASFLRQDHPWNRHAALDRRAVLVPMFFENPSLYRESQNR